MEKNRGTSFNQQEDELLCHVYLEISQDLIASNNQTLKKLWEKIEKTYNEKKTESWEIRSQRSLEGRMDTILYAVRNLKSCVIQVQNMHPSGASDQDIMEKIMSISVFRILRTILSVLQHHNLLEFLQIRHNVLLDQRKQNLKGNFMKVTPQA
ncbi:uncharacterized protein LOC130511182 [Raphanus sativus]|uniref:Uncharacterized protein LOC130511182 n=1 Tax=Raphanus sativus TaxID=3726 RepID=A0A9W3DK09_RAPSA|nr:uncharacterized protein LOC130511182 [Raphanus sativus]